MSGLKALLTGEKPVAYYPAIARAVGGIAPALFLQQIAHWCGRSRDDWAFRTQEELEEELFMKRKIQEGARAQLRKIGVLEEERRGQPAKLYYRVKWDALEALLEGNDKGPSEGPGRKGEDEVQSAQNVQSRPDQTDTLDRTKRANSYIEHESKHESNSRRDAEASPAQKNWFTFFCDLANQLDVIITPEDRQQTAKHFKDLRKNEPTEAEMKKVVSKMLEARTSGFSMSPQKALDKVRGGNVYPLRAAASSTGTPGAAIDAIRAHDSVKRYASLASRWDFTSDEAPDWTILKELGGDPSEQHKNLKRLQRVARQAVRGEAV